MTSAEGELLAKSEWRKAKSGLTALQSKLGRHETCRANLEENLRRHFAPGSGRRRAAAGLAAGLWIEVAEKATAIGYADGVLTVEVPDAAWQQQLRGLTSSILRP